MKLPKSDLFRAGVIFLVILLGHANFLFPKGAENPDANFIYPFLSKINSPAEYISKLVSLETIDFQPVRDLTLFVDVWFADNYEGFNVSIFLNCLIWTICCWCILSIIDRFIRVIDRTTSLLIVSCYAVYPIFLQSINWGISRKHLLAFMFTLLATKTLLDWFETRKGKLKIILFYTLSVLSLPISIGWPVWATIFAGLNDRKKLKETKSFFISLNVIMILLVLINWAYYKTSYTYLEVYPRKANIISPMFVVLNLGQQIWQLIYPYNLSFSYDFGKGASAGFIIFIVAFVWLVAKHRQRKDLWIWVLFAAAHSAIILTNPTLYYDTYILSPSFALLILLILLLGQKVEKFRVVLVPFFLFWFTFSSLQNKNWASTEAFFISSFENNKSCSNAIGLGFAKYSKGEKIPNELYDFIQVYQCNSPTPEDSPAMGLKKMLFESLSLYYEDEIDLDYRKQRLLKLGTKHFFPLVVYAAILTREDKAEEIEVVMKKLNEIIGDTNIEVGNEILFMKSLTSYCEKRRLPQCLKFIKIAE